MIDLTPFDSTHADGLGYGTPSLFLASCFRRRRSRRSGEVFFLLCFTELSHQHIEERKKERFHDNAHPDRGLVESLLYLDTSYSLPDSSRSVPRNVKDGKTAFGSALCALRGVLFHQTNLRRSSLFAILPKKTFPHSLSHTHHEQARDPGNPRPCSRLRWQRLGLEAAWVVFAGGGAW